MEQPTLPARRGARLGEADPDVGATFGAWVTVRRIAAGGFGTVFEARHAETGARAALKLLHAKFATSAEVLARFEREVQIIQTLDHPAIVRLLDAGFAADGRPFLCMELVDGQSLSAVIHARGRLPMSEVVAVMSPLCDALATAHERGIVHRDVKASNVMLCGERVVLLDFGIAKLSDAFSIELTATNQSLGTPTSMAPEQILGRVIDGRTDVYALGCLAFHMVTGRIPFVDDSSTMLQHLHLHARRPRASEIAAVGDGVDDALARAMAIDPGARFADPRAFLTALAACSESAPVEFGTLLGFAATAPQPPPRSAPRRATTESLEPGMRIAQYELVRELGRGGMGIVYLARDVKLGRNVAMKFLDNPSRDVAERFLIEARATARCSHDNIVIIHEVDELDDMPYMVLEYLEGTDLRKLMANEGRLPPSRVVELALPVARALARAHELGIIHRDLKPENVFVTIAGQVKVLDFGIAKAIAIDPKATPPLGIASDKLMLTGAGALIGTLPYIAPEQMSDGVDPRSDLWALGIMMFELLAGEHPIQPLTRDTVLANLFDTSPMRSVLEPAPATPPELAQLVTDCVAKAKADRIASANEVALRLAALLPASPSQSTPVSTTASTRAPSRRWIGALGIAAFAIGIAISFVLLRRPSGRSADDERRVAEMFQLAQRGDHVKAAQLVAAYLDQRPDDVDALTLQILTSWWSNGALDTKDLEVAKRLPPRQRAMLRGIELMTHRKDEEAIAFLEKADHDFPNAPELVYALGEAYWHGFRDERGVAQLERAFDLDHEWQMALHHILEYRLTRGDTSRVRPIAELLRPVDPAAAAALDCRIAIAERRYADAATSVAAAIARVAPHPDTYACQVQAQLLAGDLDAAERTAKTATDRTIDLREWGGLALEGELMLYRGRFEDYLEFTGGKRSVQRSLAISLWGSRSQAAGVAKIGLPEAGMRQAPIATAAWALDAHLAGQLPVEAFNDYPEPEINAYVRGLRAETSGDHALAIAEYKRSIAASAKGDVRMLAAHHLARVLHIRGDSVAAAAACQDVIAPRVYQGYRALLLPDCRLWSEDPVQWKRLVDTWTGSFEHPAVVEARRRLGPD